MIFWCRRWIEHSRSPTAHGAVLIGEHLNLHVVAGGQVALTEDGRVAEGRLRLAARGLHLRGSSDSSRTTRIPRPPPAEALISTGSWSVVTVSGSSSSSTGTPAAAIIFLASILEPIAATAATGV